MEKSQVKVNLDGLAKALEGQKYGFLDYRLMPAQGPIKDVWGALAQAMSS